MRRLATSGVYSVKDFDLLPIVYVKSLAPPPPPPPSSAHSLHPLVFVATPTLLVMSHTIVESKRFCSCERTPLRRARVPFHFAQSQVMSAVFPGAVVFLFVGCKIRDDLLPPPPSPPPLPPTHPATHRALRSCREVLERSVCCVCRGCKSFFLFFLACFLSDRSTRLSNRWRLFCSYEPVLTLNPCRHTQPPPPQIRKEQQEQQERQG